MLTVDVDEVVLPVYAGHLYGNGVLLPPLLGPGTFAADPASGTVVIPPGAVAGAVFIPERAGGFCCGLDGRDGPNLACAGCGQPVATRVDDCSLWQEVRFEPDAVRHVRTARDSPADAGGASLHWSSVADPNVDDLPGPAWHAEPGAWCPRWELSAGAVLAHVVAAAEGRPVGVPDGLLTTMLVPALRNLVPGSGSVPATPAAPAMPGAPGLRGPDVRADAPVEVPSAPDLPILAVAGPGLPDADPGPRRRIDLVPRHPRTGQAWQPPSGGRAVPVETDVWRYLAFGRHTAMPWWPASGNLPDGVARDHPQPARPTRPFRPGWQVFLATFARLPEAREPHLAALAERVRRRPYAYFP
ncbi:hypothetical protein [Yinghuangia soli]|uniref:Uncharacterized protein n=1 Tax=Yinghuangia soli TaxID=2908204 RepID=A0AA41Q3M6_9ACTN|nr:hypothetical protein [Yinghuangia soli]MCF2530711.1 hypothetical protein [Yinghuangia soli]